MTEQIPVQDVLDIVRKHAVNNSWCDNAEDDTVRAFGMAGVSIKLRAVRYRLYCCGQCNDGMGFEDWEKFANANPTLFTRFLLVDGQKDATIERTALLEAIERATPRRALGSEEDSEDEEIGVLINDLRAAFDTAIKARVIR